MKRLALNLLAAAIVVTMIAVPGACGQSASERSAPQGVTSFGFGPAGSVISTKQHAPFSAVVVEQMGQTLSDGTNVAKSRPSWQWGQRSSRTYSPEIASPRQ
jgi:hypothetical protein